VLTLEKPESFAFWRPAEQGFADIELVRWANFFGEQHAAATAPPDGPAGGGRRRCRRVISFPVAGRGFGPCEAYAAYMGRNLLKTFNWDEA